MANYTDNLHLKKPTYAELADIDAINDNMDIIDGVVGNASLGTAATTIKGAIAEHSGKIGNTAMGTTAATLTGAIAEHESDISGITSDMSDINQAMSGKMPKPTNTGVAGQTLANNGNGGSQWVDAQGIKYGRCTTAGNTEAKTVTIEGITALVAGMTVVVKFAYKNTVLSPTLNINNLGAKHIYPYGYTPPPPIPVDPSYPSMIGAWENESAVLLSYDGYAFTMCGWTPREYYSGYYNETLGSGTYPIAGIACTGYVLRDNSYLFVNFPTDAPKDMSENPKVTINVNGTGDKELKLNGETAINGVPAGTYLMFYDGTDFHVRNDGLIPGTVYIVATQAETQAMINDYYGG